jgi:hypothetical protein
MEDIMSRSLLLTTAAAVLVFGFTTSGTATAGGNGPAVHGNPIQCFDRRFPVSNVTPGVLLQEAMDFGGGLNPPAYADKRVGGTVGDLLGVACSHPEGTGQGNGPPT